MAKNKEDKVKTKRFKEFRDAYAITKSVKPWIGLLLAGVVVGVVAIASAIGVVAGQPIYAGILGLLTSIIIALVIFTRIAGSAAYASIEGQIGAGASVLMAIRKGWTTTPAVAVNRNQDMVHRSVGRAGIVLTGEGSQAVRQMIADERKKSERFAPGAPITEIVIGDGAGQVPLKKLQKHMAKLPKKLSAHQMRELRMRLKAVGGMSLPIPKGPMPKGIKVK
jgi:predicted lipid-binding transport protein (Tim44 family)